MNELDGTSLVEIYAAGDYIQAHLLCDLLESAGIEACIVGGILGSAGGGLPLGASSSPRIWTHQARAVEARQLIEGWEYERRGGRPERKIPPLQFSLKTMFIVTTVCAVACAFFGLVRDEPWLGLAAASVMYALQIVLFIAAYVRRRRSRSTHVDLEPT